MAVLGKRKAPEPTISSEDAQEIFRRHFEAQFLPLEEQEKSKAQKVRRNEDEDEEEDEDDSDGSGEDEWDGVSGDEISDEDDDELDDDDEEEEDEDDAPIIEVVDHSAPQSSKANTMSKRELKAFMSSRPPDQTSSSSSNKPAPTPSSSKSSSSLPEDAPSLLAQDLELRRLISESHLLQTNRPLSLSAALSTTSSGPAEPKAFASGRVRQKALDLRIQALGSKMSIHKQEKMPMHMRKGITAAAVEREAKRRREAKESGVILERETGKKKKRDRRGGGGGDGGGFGPAVGRLKGAELRISERDVKKIEGTRDTFGRRGGKDSGRKGGKR
ncbi:uncharacterized protein TrAFT101_003996 [Trichoderma asperellum]|uniref:Protein FAF1 n=1 Tax=Trichoderma asperellum (strain ATCC 204424 / CBS 433.97 / NBRC 101777) TaxID=1042311 RepID=A0A2T3ZP12_TRIA4|nr:hypothetical protein M441DRAFT_126066 [Trichoderma asperellum CBS 433.97]PTB46553.1 hypothetical protein M441DRAFT_126066 [Trichoderma asperellum CBS 433.97]UKZ88234.1 hypothetical protein TrAFT101_003996 [Trichoderma asperellum]